MLSICGIDKKKTSFFYLTFQLKKKIFSACFSTKILIWGLSQPKSYHQKEKKNITQSLNGIIFKWLHCVWIYMLLRKIIANYKLQRKFIFKISGHFFFLPFIILFYIPDLDYRMIAKLSFSILFCVWKHSW